MVLTLGTGGAIGALRYTHSVFGLGFAAIAGVSVRYAILVLLGDSSVASSSLCYAHSVLGLGFAAITGLSSSYPVLILVGYSGVARIRVHSSGSLTIAANGFTAQVFVAILRK